MILELADVHGVDLKCCTTIGDQAIDDQPARAVGAPRR
jgi:hypothetical protein